MQLSRFIFIFTLAVLSGCSHAPVKPADSSTLNDLESQWTTILAKKIESQPDYDRVNDIAVKETKQNLDDGTVHVTYRISFDTASLKDGRVTHILEGTAVLAQKSDEEWVLKRTDPKYQELHIHEGEVITRERKLSQ